VVSSIVRLLRLASLVVCAIVIASFAIFALNQTKTASKRQTEALSSTPAAAARSSAAASASAKAHESSLHKTIDNASEDFTSPFAGVVSSSSSEWLTRGVKLFLALLVYGVGVGFLARALRIRI
jgi:predicted PurR-regulated permease PerM